MRQLRAADSDAAKTKPGGNFRELKLVCSALSNIILLHRVTACCCCCDSVWAGLFAVQEVLAEAKGAVCHVCLAQVDGYSQSWNCHVTLHSLSLDEMFVCNLSCIVDRPMLSFQLTGRMLDASTAWQLCLPVA